MYEDKYWELRYWPEDLGSPSIRKRYGTAAKAFAAGKLRGLDGKFYIIYECKSVHSNLED